jgi:hypothetical protein
LSRIYVLISSLEVMASIGLNPRYGWDCPPGDAFSYGYGAPTVYDGFLPPPPPGYGWFDIGSATPSPLTPPAMPWGLPGAALIPPQWNHYGQYGQNWGLGFNGAAFSGANFHNVHGGIGMEPGYGYIFPPNHCKIHVINSPSPPWLRPGPYDKKCFNVPTNITVQELMQQFGCTNADAAKNKLVELTQGSDGTWYKGVELLGSDAKKMGKKIEEVGWNMNRNGVEADFVWLWFVKV